MTEASNVDSHSVDIIVSKSCSKRIRELQLIAPRVASSALHQPNLASEIHGTSDGSRLTHNLLPKSSKKKPWGVFGPKTSGQKWRIPLNEIRGLAAWKSGTGCAGLNGLLQGGLPMSPLDRLRSGRRERSLQFGMSPSLQESFETNQSFPRRARAKIIGKDIDLNCTSAGHDAVLNKFKGDELGSFSYCNIGRLPAKKSFTKTSESLSLLSHSFSLVESWSINSLMNSATGPLPSAVTTVYNPNKAVMTVDAKAYQILMVNDTACRLFHMCSEELCSRTLPELFVQFGRGPETLTENQLETSGQVVLISGKVLEAVLSSGEIVPVSLWMRKLESEVETRFIAVMEPVQRTTATVTFDGTGIVLCSDSNLITLLGYQNPSDIEGIDICKVIPSLVIPDLKPNEPIPKDIRKQCCTGRTKDGASFPLSIYLEPEVEGCSSLTPSYSAYSIDTDTNSLLKSILQKKGDQGSTKSSLICEASATEDESACSLESGEWPTENVAVSSSLPNLFSDPDDPKSSIYTGVIWVFANISGMITILPDGTIHSHNHYFGLMLFGYSQNQLVGKNISYLIPSFYDDQEFMDSDSGLFPPYEEDELEADIFINEQPLSTVDASNNLANRWHSQQLSSTPSEVKDNVMPNNKVIVPGTNANDAITDNHNSDTMHMAKEKSCQENGDATGNVEADINGNPARSQIVNSVVNLELLSGTKDNTEESKKHISVDEDLSNMKISAASPVNCCCSNEHSSSCTLTHNSCSPCGTPTEDSSLVITSETYDLPLPPPPPPYVHQTYAENHEITKSYSTSTPSETPIKSKRPRIFEGSYFGLGRHRDQSELAIVYQIRMIELDDGQHLYCLWVSRDPDEPAEGFRLGTSFDIASSCNSSVDMSSSIMSSGQITSEPKHHDAVSFQSSFDYTAIDCTHGPYSEHYTTLEQIGKGAFGCVKLCYGNTDKLLVVTKFIRKAKVYKECWVDDSALQKVVPLEVSLLTILNHPNIVKVLDVYENEDFLQMVMEKHGCGMDLFEFIDRAPNMDELLASYIFRQVVSAVSYLHSLNICHRDIKDENLILDEKFHIKLIDFGSATFMSPTRLFSTFCGTIEYCSPEVLSGEKYKGPELEMWSLGVTLYTLIFGENPFFDIDETIQAVLHPPFEVSKDLMNLISHLLYPDPKLRCTLRDLENNVWVYQPVNIENYSFEDVIHCNSKEANPPKVYSDLGYDE